MTLARTGDLVADAVRATTAVAAVNVITLEHAEAVVTAADQVERPVIIQVSENAVAFHAGRALPLLCAAVELADAAQVPVALHLDHVTQDALFETALTAPVSSVMYDAGALPYAENLARTQNAVARAHRAGRWLEAELGFIGGKAGQVQSAHDVGVRTDPDQAASFVEATDVDALAVAVGSVHAMTERSASLDVELIAALRDRIDVPLVLHGSSGVPDLELRAAVSAGIAKVNLGTALNVAMTRAVRQALVDPALVDPRRYLADAREAMAATVAALLELL